MGRFCLPLLMPMACASFSASQRMMSTRLSRAGFGKSSNEGFRSLSSGKCHRSVIFSQIFHSNSAPVLFDHGKCIPSCLDAVVLVQANSQRQAKQQLLSAVTSWRHAILSAPACADSHTPRPQRGLDRAKLSNSNVAASHHDFIQRTSTIGCNTTAHRPSHPNPIKNRIKIKNKNQDGATRPTTPANATDAVRDAPTGASSSTSRRPHATATTAATATATATAPTTAPITAPTSSTATGATTDATRHPAAAAAPQLPDGPPAPTPGPSLQHVG